MIVVDTNVLAYLLIPGDRTDAAERVFQRDPDWLAPALWRHEFLNVLSLYVRKALLTIDHAVELEQRGREVMHSYVQPDPRRILELSHRTGCSGYDCEFAAVAEERNLPLLTIDQKLLQQFPGLAVSMDAYLETP